MRNVEISQCQRLQVVGHVDFAAEISLTFRKIKLLACGKIFVFGVIEQQIFDVKFLRQFASVFNRRVIFAVRVENVRLRVKTKRLVQQPIGIFGVTFGELIARFVAATRQLSPADVH